jgi:hypothetical protein
MLSVVFLDELAFPGDYAVFLDAGLFLALVMLFFPGVPDLDEVFLTTFCIILFTNLDGLGSLTTEPFLALFDFFFSIILGCTSIAR